MKYSQFGKRYSSDYDSVGEVMVVYQRRERVSVVFILSLIVGVCVLGYPYLGNAWNEMTNTTAITSYKAIASRFSKNEIEYFLREATLYNERLFALTNPQEDFMLLKDYNEILNLDGNGMMGFVRIPKINVKLAIYHGFADDILDRACGHLQGSSFPVGGTNTHGVISAHRGLPSAILFSELNRMQLGDTFSIEILDKILYYQVDQIKVVDPDDSDDLKIIPGEDHVTLLTCTPYGINTHRLLVRGVRVDNPYGYLSNVRSEAFRLDPYMVCLILSILILCFLIIYVISKYRKKRPVANVDLDELERQWIVKKIGENGTKARK